MAVQPMISGQYPVTTLSNALGHVSSSRVARGDLLRRLSEGDNEQFYGESHLTCPRKCFSIQWHLMPQSSACQI